MRRYRWLRANWPISIRSLAKRLRSKGFEDGLAEGFVIDRVRDDYLEARFIERVEYDDSVIDPFGRETLFHRVEYKQCEFRASIDGGPGLELVDAPRAVQAMISRLAEVNDFGLAISPISVDVIAWAKAVQDRLGVRGFVDSLQIGSLELAPGVDAKMLVRSSGDVLQASRQFVSEKKHIVEKAQLRIHASRREVLIFSRNGSVRIESENNDEIISVVREAMEKQLSRT